MTYDEVFALVFEQSPPLGDFPAKGLVLLGTFRPKARKAGWPVRLVNVVVEHPESVDSKGWHRPARQQVVTVQMVPATWVAAAAKLLGRRWQDMVSGKYGG